MNYKGETTSVVKEGEKVDIVPKDKKWVEISYSVTFHEYGVYRVDVSDKRIVISKEEKLNKWIPVSEKMPEESGVYLTFITNRLGYPQMEVDGFVRGKWERFGNNVIAWMPLPEPYDAESEE